MADNKSSVAGDAHAPSSGPEEAAEQPAAPLSARVRLLCGACLRAAVVALVGYIFAATAWRVRRDDPRDGRVLVVAVLLFVSYSVVQTALRVRDEPWNVAFVVLGYADLASLFWCVWRAEGLVTQAGSSPAAAEERRRLHHAVWALSTALSCGFAYKVSTVMPANLVVVFWCMTWFIVLVGFYVLVVSNDHHMCRRGDSIAGNGERLQEIVPADELV